MSDSDSDDDSLLGEEVFTKRSSRVEKAKETRANNFLDNLANETEERLNRQERMNQMKIEDEKDFIPSEEDNLELNFSRSGNGNGNGNGTASPAESEKDDADSNPRPSKLAKKEGNNYRSAPQAFQSPNEVKAVPVSKMVLSSRVKAIIADSQEKKVSLSDRRKNIMDRIDGVALETCEEYGSPGGDKATREQLMAAQSGVSSTLGMRQTLGWHRDRNEGVNSDSEMIDLSQHLRRFSSSKNAMNELKKILKQCDSAPPRSLDNDGKKQWNNMRQGIIKSFKKVISLDIKFLPRFLEKKWPAEMSVPEELFVWLMRAAISGMNTGITYCNEASSMVQTLLRTNSSILRFQNGKQEEVKNLFQLNEFLIMLESQFGMWTDDSEKKSPKNKEDGKGEAFDNPYGLRNALSIWITLIEQECVGVPGDSNEAKKELSRCISKLLLCGLDPVFYSGCSLLEVKGKLIESILTLAQRQINEVQNPGVSDEMISWIKITSLMMHNECRNNSLQLPKSNADENDDVDDENRNEWLLADLLLRSWQDVDQRNELYTTFFYFLSRVMLQSCLGGRSNLYDRSEELSSKMSTDETQIRFKAIATAESAFIALTESDIMHEPPHFLASVGIANHCEQTGVALFMINAQNQGNSSSTGICESVKEAVVLHDHFDRLIHVTAQLKIRMPRVVGNINMQRAVKLITQLKSYFMAGKGRAAIWGKCEDRKKQQSNV
eukprot:CAMPEP_0194105896 /NCGR_PEP_ID=MMETSP0150-20130528/6015_1 /TAXON_ID=122233 /ORGANISM="Chaetoceros debilis, Strain MM31A-1" /LENGTH=719 /DNA_ID=CAMNT_0038793889 /DNA_START=48 /DNA_END=2204 /DNA_ORIENTATION=+